MRRGVGGLLVAALFVLFLSASAGAEDPAGLAPVPADKWDAVKAAHLLKRAGFGGLPQEVLRLASMSPEQAVSSMVDWDRPREPESLIFPRFDPSEERHRMQLKRYEQRFLRSMRKQRARRLTLDLAQALSQPVPTASERTQRKGLGIPANLLPGMFRRVLVDRFAPRLTKRQKLSMLYNKSRRGLPLTPAEMQTVARGQALAAVRRRYESGKLTRLFNWWIGRMIESRRPLEEKMVLFWHGHFATSYATVRNGEHMKLQNDLFRQQALGNFEQLVRSIARDPAMLRYLDGNRNKKRKPNENFARELLELFTIGIGNYTEKDIREAARAFTGWSYRGNRFVMDSRNHDDGQKTFMGQTGNWSGDDIVRIILGQPKTARFIVRKLCKFFLAESPDPAIVKALAWTFRDSNYELRPVLRRLLLSQAFYRAQSIGTQIKSPVQLVIGTVRTLGLDLGEAQDLTRSGYRHVDRALRQMGQHLFHPPNVKGWDGGRVWINSQTMLVRYNMVRDLIAQGESRSRRAWQQQRRKAPKKAGRRPPPFQLKLIEALSGLESPEQLIRHLTGVLLQRRLPPVREAQLRAILAPEGEQFEVESKRTRERLRKVIILITSMPEYQLS